MSRRFLLRALYSALLGHLVAFGLVILFSMIALSLENPSSAVLPIAFVSLGAGACVVGIAVRKSQIGLLGALCGGGFFVFVPFFCSSFGVGDVFSFGMRLLVVLVAFLLVLVVVFLFPKSSRKKRRRGLMYRRK